MAPSVTPPAYIADRAIAFLPPGSEIRQVFVSQTAPHFACFLPAYLFGVFVKVRFRCVAVTDDAIYVMEGTRASGGARSIRLLGVMPRSTRFEPAAGLTRRQALPDRRRGPARGTADEPNTAVQATPPYARTGDVG
ncbi:hypothetical protein [Nocardia niigatensis]